MKNKNYSRVALMLGIISLLSASLNAQWVPAGNNLVNAGILGSNNNFEVYFRTDGINRVKLMQTGTSIVNGFTIDRSGFLGLSTQPNFFTTGAATPFALLHLNGDNPMGFPESLGYRPWMRHGIVYTHNQDIMYVGPRSNLLSKPQI